MLLSIANSQQAEQHFPYSPPIFTYSTSNIPHMLTNFLQLPEDPNVYQASKNWLKLRYEIQKSCHIHHSLYQSTQASLCIIPFFARQIALYTSCWQTLPRLCSLWANINNMSLYPLKLFPRPSPPPQHSNSKSPRHDTSRNDKKKTVKRWICS